MGMFRKFKDWLFSKSFEFDWIQVEVTSYCNAHCVYCPRTIYKDKWINRHLDMETFLKLKPVLKNVKLVYLQGWGEPLLNPHLFDMIKTSKGKGCMVGLTSNATTLNSDTITKLIELEVDIIALSLAGNEKKNDTIRKGTSFSKVISVVEEFKRQKAFMRKHKPVINIAYLLLGKEIDELYEVVDSLEGKGIDNIIVSGLVFVCSNSLKPFFNYLEHDSSQLIQIIKYSLKKGLHLTPNIFITPEPRKICSENITGSLFVSSDGSVSPCIFMNIPVRQEFGFSEDDLEDYYKFTFGSLEERSLIDIWQSEGYLAFRKGFLEGNYTNKCKKCPNLYIYDFKDMK